jgi:hypothetical protein
MPLGISLLLRRYVGSGVVWVVVTTAIVGMNSDNVNVSFSNVCYILYFALVVNLLSRERVHS